MGARYALRVEGRSTTGVHGYHVGESVVVPLLVVGTDVCPRLQGVAVMIGLTTAGGGLRTQPGQGQPCQGRSSSDSFGQSTCWTVTPWATSYTRHATEDADFPASGGSREPDLICLYRSTRNRVPRRQRTTHSSTTLTSGGLVSTNHVCAASARAVGEVSPREPSSLRSASGRS